MSRNNLKVLQAKWYKKLKDTGFNDIEDDKGRLINWSGRQLQDDLVQVTSKGSYRASEAEYYRLASQYLHEKKFPSKAHKTIWALHAEGLTQEAIALKLSLPKATVQHRIERLRKIFYEDIS